MQRDCGQRLWDFYIRDLGMTPRIPIETEDVLRHMVKLLLQEGYAGFVVDPGRGISVHERPHRQPAGRG